MNTNPRSSSKIVALLVASVSMPALVLLSLTTHGLASWLYLLAGCALLLPISALGLGLMPRQVNPPELTESRSWKVTTATVIRRLRAPRSWTWDELFDTLNIPTRRTKGPPKQERDVEPASFTLLGREITDESPRDELDNLLSEFKRRQDESAGPPAE